MRLNLLMIFTSVIFTACGQREISDLSRYLNSVDEIQFEVVEINVSKNSFEYIKECQIMVKDSVIQSWISDCKTPDLEISQFFTLMNTSSDWKLNIVFMDLFDISICEYPYGFVSSEQWRRDEKREDVKFWRDYFSKGKHQLGRK